MRTSPVPNPDVVQYVNSLQSLKLNGRDRADRDKKTVHLMFYVKERGVPTASTPVSSAGSKRKSDENVGSTRAKDGKKLRSSR
jgi:hypothetical protein